MLLLAIPTPKLQPGDDLAALLMEGAVAFETNDILVVSSKAIGVAEDALVDLAAMTPSAQAQDISRQTGRSAEFCEAMFGELQRLHGTVVGTCPGAALTEVRPEGLAAGTILVANAGLDESNVPKGFAVGWPADPVASLRNLREKLGGGKRIAVILTDSCCAPRRQGVTAIALAVSGLDPLQSQKGKADLFGKPLKITTEAIADQLATAANFLMGNANQSVPAVVIRSHGLALSDWEGWVPGIEPDEDLFRKIV